MRHFGIALIVVAVLALPVPFLAAILGLFAVVQLSPAIYLACATLFVLGILVTAVGTRVDGRQRTVR